MESIIDGSKNCARISEMWALTVGDFRLIDVVHELELFDRLPMKPPVLDIGY